MHVGPSLEPSQEAHPADIWMLAQEDTLQSMDMEKIHSNRVMPSRATQFVVIL